MADSAEADDVNDVPVDGKGDSAFSAMTAAVDNPVGKIALKLLKDFINDGLDKRNVKDAPKLDDEFEIERKLTPEELDTCINVGHQLQAIGDKFQEDEALKRQIDCLFVSMPKIDTIMTVADVIFGDTKNLNWGRIVALFYFALETISRAMKFMTKDSLLRWIMDLIYQIALFIIRHFSNWIVGQGGWNALVKYYNQTASNTLVTVIAIAAIVGIYFIYMNRSK